MQKRNSKVRVMTRESSKRQLAPWLLVLFTLAALLAFRSQAVANNDDSCGTKPSARAQEWLSKLNVSDSDQRGRYVFCLARYHIDRTDVAQTLLQILKNPEEDLFVREDVAIALRYVQWRKRIAVRQDLGPTLSVEDSKAIGRALASVKPIIDMSQNIKQISSIVPATKFEEEFMQALLDIFSDSQAHVQFRIAAINSISYMVEQMVESDIYSEKLIRTTYDNIQSVSKQSDFSNYYAGADFGMDRFSKLLARLETKEPNHPLVRSLASANK